MRNSKGFTLIELLVVLVILALIIALTTAFFIEEINKSRGSTLISEARMVLFAAYTVILENVVTEPIVSDEDFIKGLSGVGDVTLLSTHDRLAARLQALLEPDIHLAKEPTEEAASVSFVVENATLMSMEYSKLIGPRLYTVTIEEGEERQAEVRYERIR
jgi:prepilin-type N-terminal cleavage/methylation domain-containing protein